MNPPPWTAPVPLEYRNALDAAVTLLGGQAPLVRCHVPPLLPEVARRFADQPSAPPRAMLWVEPTIEHWAADLRAAASAPAGTRLVVMLSQPLARLIAERRSWPLQPIGMQATGPGRVYRQLRALGYERASAYGLHSLGSILLLRASDLASRAGRPDLADRLHFAARLRYIAQRPLASLATVGLWALRRGREPS